MGSAFDNDLFGFSPGGATNNYSLHSFVPHKLKTLSSEFYHVLPFLADEFSRLSSWLHAELWTPELSLLSLSSVSHVLKTVFGELNMKHLVEVKFSCKTICGCYKNNCLPSRYNGDASVRCVGNDYYIPLSDISSQYKVHIRWNWIGLWPVSLNILHNSLPDFEVQISLRDSLACHRFQITPTVPSSKRDLPRLNLADVRKQRRHRPINPMRLINEWSIACIQ
jgi:hypothetical protein